MLRISRPRRECDRAEARLVAPWLYRRLKSSNAVRQDVLPGREAYVPAGSCLEGLPSGLSCRPGTTVTPLLRPSHRQ